MLRILLFAYLFLVLACQNEAVVKIEKIDSNPAAPGFNAAASDAKAIALADSVMLAMGGRKAWDQTRYLAWNFFGRRHLLWDKHTGRVRISMQNDSTVYLVNIKDESGQIKQNGIKFTQVDSLKKYLERAKNIWINDSYWLVMPYKLKDSGVTLKYLGQDTMIGGKQAEVLQLTFEDIGKTPENKYLVYVNPSNYFVEQWDYYSTASDSNARLSTPWGEWKSHGKIMLSEDRGRRDLSEVQVLTELPDSVFTSFHPIDL